MTGKLAFRREAVNAAMLIATGVCTLIAAGTLIFILGYLMVQGGSSLSWNSFTKLPVPVGESGGGMANAIVGSGKVLLIASSIGIPIGFLGGVYLSEYGTAIVGIVVRFAADLLNGVPSIVIGIFAYAFIVVRVKHFSAYAGGVALGIMMIPIGVRTTEAFLRTVPQSLREGAMALGARKEVVIATVVIPAARRGIAAGMLLNLARVAGETAPLLFTALNNQFWSPGFDQPIATLPVMIYTYAIAPYPDWHRQAWAAGFVLLMLVFTVNIAARWAIASKTVDQRR
ncbi:MAG: phosphate ABC transporter permease PstA [Acidobacteriota bacterium]|nr:phosphate ABC transporter permease PstA [Acidobacteriota bacterium]